MKILNIIFGLAFMACTITLCQSQTVYYSYDSVGNRTARSLSLLKSTAQEGNAEQPEQPEFKDEVGGQDILIYPNPVQSELIVKIPGLEENEYASISVYGQGGNLLYRNEKATKDNSISFSGFSAGIYYMKIQAGEESVQWKIVKE
jgi:hypothetical protein